jgi:RNA polymerase sigma factor (sigma-70 family)
MKSYEHSDFFPKEAFNSERLEREEYTFSSHLMEELYKARQQLIEENGGTWNKETEEELAGQIQAGLKAEDEAATLDEADEEQRQAIQIGKDARYKLVVANLPFAVACARASVGIRPFPHDTAGSVPSTSRGDSSYLGLLKEPGTYAKLSSLNHPYASFEDRIQVAMEAMWRAANRYKQRSDEDEPSKRAKFTTFAAWEIQSRLSTYAHHERSTGWSMTQSIYDRYTKLLDESTPDAPPRAIHREGGYHLGLHPLQAFNGRDTTNLDSVFFSAPEEADTFGDTTQLGLAEVVLGQQSLEAIVDKKHTAQMVQEALKRLPEADANVITMYFGLDGKEAKTLDEIAGALKIAPMRAEQVLKKRLGNLRYLRSRGLLQNPNHGEPPQPPTSLSPLAEGTSHIRTVRATAADDKY